MGSFESVSTAGHGTSVSMAEAWAIAIGGHGRWPFNTSEVVVLVMDVTAMGHSVSDSTDGARSHRFLQQSRVCDGPLPGAPTIGVL